MKVEYFYYMVEIAKIGSISRAADNLYLSQPYLSLELKNLEKKIGTPLLSRNSKGVTLTPAGEKFVEYANEIISTIDKMNKLSENLDKLNNKLSISSMYSFTFLDLYYEFSNQNKFEEDRIIYEEMPNEFISEKIKNGNADIGIIYLNTNTVEFTKDNFSIQGMHFVPLIDEPLCAVVHNENPISRLKCIDINQMKDCMLIIEKQKYQGKNSSVQNIILPMISKSCIQKPIYFDNNRSLLYYLTKNRKCFTVGQKSLNITNPFVISGELVYVPICNLQDTLTTGYLINENYQSSEVQEDFINYIESYFQDYNKNMI